MQQPTPLQIIEQLLSKITQKLLDNHPQAFDECYPLIKKIVEQQQLLTATNELAAQIIHLVVTQEKPDEI